MVMTRRWLVTAIVFAALGFVSIAVKLVTPQYVTDANGDWVNFCPGRFPPCLEPVYLDPTTTVLIASLNAAIWFGVVYLVFVVVSGIRWLLRRVLRVTEGKPTLGA